MSPPPNKKSLESLIKGSIRKFLQQHGWVSWPVTQTVYSKGGVADIHAVKLGLFMVIEAKRTSKDKPTPLQVAFLKAIKGQQHFAFVVNGETLASFKSFLEALDRSIEAQTHQQMPSTEDGATMLECIRIMENDYV